MSFSKDNLKTDTNRMDLCQLPPEILLMIIEKLDINDILPLVVAFPSLKHLVCVMLSKETNVNFNFCDHITDTFVISIVKNCQSLTSVDLSCTNITDLSLFALAEHCPKLVSIDFWHCGNITESGVKALRDNCLGLARISIRDVLDEEEYDDDYGLTKSDLIDQDIYFAEKLF